LRKIGLLLGAALLLSGCSSASWTWWKSNDSGSTDGGGSLFGSSASDKSEFGGMKNPLAMARLCERRGMDDQAERMYKELIKEQPKNPEPYHRLAVMYAKHGRFKEADEYFARALALKPDVAELLGDAGYFYYLASRPRESEDCLRHALELDPNNRTYCTNLALLLGEEGRHEESLALFRRAGNETQAQANYAFVLAQRGEYRQSMDAYNRVLTADQSNRIAADAMIELSRYADRPAVPPQVLPGNERPALAQYQPPVPPGYPPVPGYLPPQGYPPAQGYPPPQGYAPPQQAYGPQNYPGAMPGGPMYAVAVAPVAPPSVATAAFVPQPVPAPSQNTLPPSQMNVVSGPAPQASAFVAGPGPRMVAQDNVPPAESVRTPAVQPPVPAPRSQPAPVAVEPGAAIQAAAYVRASEPASPAPAPTAPPPAPTVAFPAAPPQAVPAANSSSGTFTLVALAGFMLIGFAGIQFVQRKLAGPADRRSRHPVRVRRAKPYREKS